MNQRYTTLDFCTWVLQPYAEARTLNPSRASLPEVSVRPPMIKCVSEYLSLPQNCRLALPLYLVHTLTGRVGASQMVEVIEGVVVI